MLFEKVNIGCAFLKEMFSKVIKYILHQVRPVRLKKLYERLALTLYNVFLPLLIQIKDYEQDYRNYMEYVNTIHNNLERERNINVNLKVKIQTEQTSCQIIHREIPVRSAFKRYIRPIVTVFNDELLSKCSKNKTENSQDKPTIAKQSPTDSRRTILQRSTESWECDICFAPNYTNPFRCYSCDSLRLETLR
ncbi:uncharacterized protein LOC111618783 [Centruroides sculpturatus]|uniref:uncharacterized protein LOC111618783 n=1 Tax=Centruroides sculpturatus TaxID=218467 RepID=UPI000C6DE02B|nr:uncharacterized protein LOC111618783 [Centruroides sculpturatus]